MNRRRFLRAASAAPLLGLGGCGRFSFEQGLFSECRTVSLAADPLVAEAWRGLDPAKVWDVHVHLLGNGRSRGGIWVEPSFDRPFWPEARVRHAFFRNGACMGDDEERFDNAMVTRLTQIADQLPAGAKLVLLGFDFTFDEKGAKREDLTTFSVPNAYARQVAQMRPDRFEWTASVHPYRADAAEQLAQAKAGGARAIKWLPPSMGIDLRAPQSLAFYDLLAKHDLPLLVHVGEEQAVAGANRHELANPLFMRVPLERGVRVIAAHCATLGGSPDYDANPNPDKAPKVPDFDLFTRLMADRRYEGRLFGEISAVTQANRGDFLPRLLRKREWDGRLLNGSDYPLPGILPLFSLNRMVRDGILEERLVPGLRALRHANALLFDFVLKRHLKSGSDRFPDSTFETRAFFR